ncbi:hypothetical protein HQ346_02440 [Rhodococcus sp. BP-252]|uniref:hypothetical protein n=1 Tax=unclassified Rhodococcus (in: high G+C Gram-positive bacteria) TaxID=192944 RepID=UPI001C9BBA20|nr:MULTISPECIES: hypothetical protein [unclassified Rhodococcus (in: high G+C Gram-positive bacteria)]MBY6410411.1 hypothetical protein [Rhodococcus sp. BP-320]MBY6416293.1 hypothetical protein [Rhodococcus sp. BP-321]MBY6420288.1 hypothetical protein [Rhodococcus sp. BP-324]MBY6424967.1 hypothetical protein [Rhodococcus sp. BP-323]MBY6430327.1 hypothetical protein [Rhodococcus sp. BP-322]
MSADVCHLVIGPRKHGVVEYAVSVHEALAAEGVGHRRVLLDTPWSPLPSDLSACGLVHLHVTDRLFGTSPAQASKHLLSVVEAVGRPVSVTLHDLPQPSDGSSMNARVEFYRTAVDAAAGVVVSSEHEAGLLKRHVAPEAVPEVVPLMIGSRVQHPMSPTPAVPTVGVLGFLYPGKGHIETLRAMAGLPSTVGFLALGAPSPGHEDLVDELRFVAAESGRSCEVTGYLDDDEMHERMRGVTVPVAYHRHMSASGSINTWIAQGRRPLVPRSDYIDELDRRSPGVVTIHGNDDESLQSAIFAAVEDSSTTWLDPSVDPVPSPSDVAKAYAEVLARWRR